MPATHTSLLVAVDANVVMDLGAESGLVWDARWLRKRLNSVGVTCV